LNAISLGISVFCWCADRQGGISTWPQAFDHKEASGFLFMFCILKVFLKNLKVFNLFFIR
jgi:hypothetical protein